MVWGVPRKDPDDLKGKRYTTEDKIRILRDADWGKSILEVCRAHNISEVSFHRWKREFGQMDLSEARKLKELEPENGELKNVLAESLLKNRVLEAVAGKGRPGSPSSSSPRRDQTWVMFRADGVPLLLLAQAAFLYRGRRPSTKQDRLAKQLRVFSRAHPRYGYRRIAALYPRKVGPPANARCNGCVVPMGRACP